MNIGRGVIFKVSIKKNGDRSGSWSAAISLLINESWVRNLGADGKKSSRGQVHQGRC